MLKELNRGSLGFKFEFAIFLGILRTQYWLKMDEVFVIGSYSDFLRSRFVLASNQIWLNFGLTSAWLRHRFIFGSTLVASVIRDFLKSPNVYQNFKYKYFFKKSVTPDHFQRWRCLKNEIREREPKKYFDSSIQKKKTI